MKGVGLAITFTARSLDFALHICLDLLRMPLSDVDFLSCSFGFAVGIGPL